jgi:type I restriction enzyme S subunit
MNGDTLVARITPCLENGKIGFVDFLAEGEVAFGSTEFIVLREKAGVSTRQYIYYFAYWNEFRDLAVQLMTGTSGRQRVETDVLKQRGFRFPLIPTQKAIAEVLSSLDDKIDLLSRQNSTLESLAQTYFRQWFIEVPCEDWEENGLDGIADFLNGLPLQKYPCKSGKPLNVIKIKELNSGYSDNSDICTADVPEKYIVHAGDVIFSWSGSLVVDIWKYDKGALNQHLFKVTSGKYPKWFYYYWIKYHLQEFLIIAESKATTMGHIQRGHLTAAKVLVPSDGELETMSKTMQPLIEKIERNNAQILTLQKLRDTLLPKLISGEVRVKQ